jgi:hypothetical protein
MSSIDRHRAAITAAFVTAVRTYLPDKDAKKVIDEALAAGGNKQMPTEPQAIRAFAMGPLWRVLVDNYGVKKFALEAGKIARSISEISKPTSERVLPAVTPESLPPRIAVAVTLDANVYERLRAAAPDDVELRRAHRLLDIAPLSALRKNAPSTLVVHVDTSPVSLTTLARMTQVLSQECRVVLAGVSERALAQLVRMYPAIERWERMATLEEAAAAL